MSNRFEDENDVIVHRLVGPHSEPLSSQDILNAGISLVEAASREDGWIHARNAMDTTMFGT